jgi:hypothetical protein
MNKKFTKADLKVGYVVKYRDGILAMVMPGRNGNLIMIDKMQRYAELSYYEDDLLGRFREHDYIDIVEVYGYSHFNYTAMDIVPNDRELLWKREETPKKTCDDCIHKVVCSHVGTCEHFAEKK